MSLDVKSYHPTFISDLMEALLSDPPRPRPHLRDGIAQSYNVCQTGFELVFVVCLGGCDMYVWMCIDVSKYYWKDLGAPVVQ